MGTYQKYAMPVEVGESQTQASKYPEIELNVAYRSTRHGKTNIVYPIGLKSREVVLKNDPTQKHSFGMSLKEFHKFYRKVE